MERVMEAERYRLNDIADQHSYALGFNGRLTKYRAQTIFELCSGTEKSVLDVGCGEGLLTHYLVSQFQTVHAVDASDQYIEKAKRRLPTQVTFVLSLVEEF